jgi:P-type conjugative transfer protein TrbJ
MRLKAIHLPEPLLSFAHGQSLEAPKDGLFLFGPVEDSSGRSQVRLGIIGTPEGVGLARLWLKRLSGFIPGKTGKNGEPVSWALEQINNQVRQLQNQAQVLLRMDQNLSRLGGTISPDLQRTLADLQSQLRAGDGIALNLRATESAYERLFPRQLSAAFTADEALRNAKARWEEEYASLRRAALLQGQVIDHVDADARLLDTAMARSRNAAGALEVTQAGNEILALSVKQALQLQGLLAAQQRSETLTRAGDLATEDEARQRFKTFLGNGRAYAASR